MIKYFHEKKVQKGFTLIELLVVIAIIGVLATIVLVSLNTARSKARDSRRVSDMRQLALALEMYYDDNDAYIDSGAACVAATEANLGGLTPDYMGTLPSDPGTGSYSYGADATEQDYVLRAVVENSLPDGSYTTDIYGCSCDQATEYCIRP